ncbi:hypothetical protein PVAP13_6NG215900 [Panicum virgatum]|uniref:Uncharacterized protein n=1 Tax=Panicum virgatum TaxID=38727 RepID=A0A8T0R4J5_PANVG|nr:hypothetical protein PVAP13_6NG215900 [Panicum virgatum]
MAPSEDCGWLLYLSLAAKCGGPHRLLGFAAVVAAAFVVTALLHWASPGGPAWGWYWWTRRAGLGIVGAAIPGPRGLPVLGSMGLMTGLAHRKLAAAGKARRRLMAFSLGETRVVVTADPDVARELLASAAFADRPVKESAYGLLFHRAIGFAPHGAYWRALRRVASAHLFSPRQIAGSAAQRAVIARQMVDAMTKQQGGAGAVRARRFLKRASLHNVMWSVFGRRYELLQAADGEEAAELKSLVDQGYDLLGQLNWSDHLPWLARFDLQRTRARCAALVPRVNRFVGRIIDEHRAARLRHGGAAAVMDFTDVLLSLQGSDRLSDADMIAVLWVHDLSRHGHGGGSDRVGAGPARAAPGRAAQGARGAGPGGRAGAGRDRVGHRLARLPPGRRQGSAAPAPAGPAALLGTPRHVGRARRRAPRARGDHRHGEHVGHNP